MNFQEFKNLVIAACEEAGITEYELYYQAGSSVSVDTFQHSINEFSSSQSGGVCFRCILGGKMGYASTEAMNAEQAKAIVAKAVMSRDDLKHCPHGRPICITLSKKQLERQFKRS